MPEQPFHILIPVQHNMRLNASRWNAQRWIGTCPLMRLARMLCTLCCFTATGASYQIIPWILRRATVKKIISKETNSISGYENLSSCSRDYSRQLMAEKNYLYFLNFQDTVATHVYKIKVTKSHFLGILCTKIYSNRSCLAELFKK